MLLPARGVSAIDREGQPFDDPAARRALHDGDPRGLPSGVVTELDLHINDPEFAEAAAQRLIEMLAARERGMEVTRISNEATKHGETENTKRTQWLLVSSVTPLLRF